MTDCELNLEAESKLSPLYVISWIICSNKYLRGYIMPLVKLLIHNKPVHWYIMLHC